MEKEHTGENMSKCLFDIIKDYNIKKILDYIIIDDAPDNDIIIMALLRVLY